MRLTATSIRTLTLPDGAADRTYFCDDLPGFGLRLRAAGGQAWIVQYAVGGKTRRVTLGSSKTVSVGQAREQAQRILAQVKLGADPAAEKRLGRVRAGETVGGLLPRFLERQRARLRPRSLVETVRHLERQIAKLHPLPVSALDRRTVAVCLSEIAATSGPAAANRVRGSLSAYCVWLAQEGLIELNPVAHLNKAIENGPRSRLLTDSEVRTIWAAAGDGQYGAIVRLLCLTGCRRDEIGSLRWSEVDLDKALITLPPGRTKGKRGHLIPLAEAALKIIAAQPRRTNADGSARDLIFGGAGQGFSDWSGAKGDLDARIAASLGGPIPGWTLHDFRRVVSTALHERLGVPPHLVEAILGHAGGHKAGVAGVYNKALYLDERRRALQQWADHIEPLGERQEASHGCEAVPTALNSRRPARAPQTP